MVTRGFRLLFFIPTLVFALCALCAGGEESAVATADSPEGMVSVEKADRLLMLYNRKKTPFKPYVKELCTPGGLNVLLDSPDDHKHHHGLMFALGAAGIDFWGEHDDQVVGCQESVGLELLEGEGGAGFRDSIAWRGPQGGTILDETRTVRLVEGAKIPATLITFETALTPARGRGAVPLSGSHYYGLGLRFLREMNGEARFIHGPGADGKVFRGDERLTPGRWCALQSTASGKPVTVTLFDHDLNSRHPAVFFTMSQPFAYLAATLHLHRNPRVLREGEELTLRYGVALFDGHVGAEKIEELYGRWSSIENPLGRRPNVALAARGTEAYASTEYGPDYCAQKAIDGRFLVREKDKWNSKAYITPHYVRLDFGAPVAIDTVVIRHEGVLPILDAFVNNTADYRLQSSPRQWGPWSDIIPPVRANSDNVTVHRFDPVTTRYLRLLIETSEQRGGYAYGRIVELEAYGPQRKNNDK